MENASTGDHKTRLLSQGSTLSGLWLQVVPSQPRHRMAPATFRFAIRAYLGLPLPGRPPPTLRMCPACHAQVDPIGTYWLSTCTTARAAFTRRHTALNHTVRAAFHKAGYFPPLLEPQLFAPIPKTGNVGLRTDLLAVGTLRSTGLLCRRGSYLAHCTIPLDKGTISPRFCGGQEISREDAQV